MTRATLIFVVATIYQVMLVGAGFYVGRIDGEDIGYTRAVATHAAAKEEHDAIMHKLGLCKWAQIWAEDTRCKSERP